nr:MAG TPA: hypothetical protein [Bacteriophage sp.]
MFSLSPIFPIFINILFYCRSNTFCSNIPFRK